MSDAARASVAFVVDHNPLPVLAAAVQPLFAGVSAVANAPSRVVALTANAVDSAVSSARAVYQAAVSSAGAVVSAVSVASRAVGEFAQDHWRDIAAVGAVSGLAGGALGKLGGAAVSRVATKFAARDAVDAAAVDASQTAARATAEAADSGPAALEAGSRVAPWAGTSLSRVTQTEETMYRVWGGESGRAGEWLTPIDPTSSAAARQGLALPAGNTAGYVSRVTVPAGTRIQVGTAGGAFGQTGGWTQVQLLERIHSANFGNGVPLGP